MLPFEFIMLFDLQRSACAPLLDQTRFFLSSECVTKRRSFPEFSPPQTFQSSPSTGAFSSVFAGSFFCFLL